MKSTRKLGRWALLWRFFLLIVIAVSITSCKGVCGSRQPPRALMNVMAAPKNVAICYPTIEIESTCVISKSSYLAHGQRVIQFCPTRLVSMAGHDHVRAFRTTGLKELGVAIPVRRVFWKWRTKYLCIDGARHPTCWATSEVVNTSKSSKPYASSNLIGGIYVNHPNPGALANLHGCDRRGQLSLKNPCRYDRGGGYQGSEQYNRYVSPFRLLSWSVPGCCASCVPSSADAAPADRPSGSLLPIPDSHR